LYRQLHKIENFFQWIKIHKPVSSRYDKLALGFTSFTLVVAVVFDWLKSF
jgi:transposase